MPYLNNSWTTIEEMFQALHQNHCRYIILRNYEEIDADNFYTSGHADIDFLTDNCKKFAKTIHARPRFGENDGIHFLVTIGGTDVMLDVRSVGDGYYDKNWQKALLKNRQLMDERFYIADFKNYYYSLVYHAILQKNQYAADYDRRLNAMAQELRIPSTGREAHLTVLKSFMKAHQYRFTIPYDIWVPLNQDYLQGEAIYISPKVRYRDVKQHILQAGSRIKHKILKR